MGNIEQKLSEGLYRLIDPEKLDKAGIGAISRAPAQRLLHNGGSAAARALRIHELLSG